MILCISKQVVFVISNLESVLREIDGSMAMEGMPLHAEDKDRILRCLSDMRSNEKAAGSSVKKHTVSAGTMNRG